MSRVYLGGKKDPSNTSDHNNTDYDFSRVHTFKTSLDESTNSKEFQFIWSRLQMAASGLSNKDNPLIGQGEVASPVVISRKRKAWEGSGRPVSNKYVGSGRLPSTRGPEDEEEREGEEAETAGGGLDTPVCSRTGFEDETNDGTDGEARRTEGGELVNSTSHHKSTLLSPMNPNLLNVDDIDTDNLAADFDGSFTGLGVDIATASYSMSEAMLSLNNIVINNSHIKQESGDRYSSMKSDTTYMFSNYGALDLSNDEAQHPKDGDEATPPPTGPQTFSGSVSRDNSMDQVKFSLQAANLKDRDPLSVSAHQYMSPENRETKADIVGKALVESSVNEISQANAKPSKVEMAPNLQSYEENDSSYMYILTAPTSIATKVGEPSLTYINQGQSYELKMKKLGDLSNHYKKKWLRSTIRICFHERRLQYIEAEQISEWARSHPNERILEVDMPLSYGIGDIRQEYDQLNQVSFSWDPTRETGVFIKVHCISTEFTPKKHGGERGVPFRLQVETWFNEARVHAAACILQVFKLKGADRKHKQDREKLQKRPPLEQDKFSQQCECTVLSDLSVDSIYIPPSRGISPVQSDNENLNAGGSVTGSLSGGGGMKMGGLQVQVKASSVPPSTSTSMPSEDQSVNRLNWASQPSGDSKSWRRILPGNAGVEATASWLSYHRYNEHLKMFQNCDAQDLLRFTKTELIQSIGNIDGIRLFNDLHMTPVGPRQVFYLAQKEDSIFNPVLLKDATTSELAKLLALIFQISEKYKIKIIASGPNKIPVRMTDEYLRYQDSGSSYIVSFIYDDSVEVCTAHLEKVSFHQS